METRQQKRPASSISASSITTAARCYSYEFKSEDKLIVEVNSNPHLNSHTLEELRARLQQNLDVGGVAFLEITYADVSTGEPEAFSAAMKEIVPSVRYLTVENSIHKGADEDIACLLGVYSEMRCLWVAHRSKIGHFPKTFSAIGNARELIGISFCGKQHVEGGMQWMTIASARAFARSLHKLPNLMKVVFRGWCVSHPRCLTEICLALGCIKCTKNRRLFIRLDMHGSRYMGDPNGEQPFGDALESRNEVQDCSISQQDFEYLMNSRATGVPHVDLVRL